MVIAGTLVVAVGWVYFHFTDGRRGQAALVFVQTYECINTIQLYTEKWSWR